MRRSSLAYWFFVFSCLTLLAAHSLRAEGQGLDPDVPGFETPAVVTIGTPGDLLMTDPVVPGFEGRTEQAAGSGTMQKSLSNQLAVPVISTGVPGNAVQVRGLGRSAEDTDVQALGIPLNPPQGGGFDLSIFPPYLWSSYRFQPGPALGTFDPRGTGGSLTLTPWTACALAQGAREAGSSGSLGRIAGLGSSARVFQISAAASNGGTLAAVAGLSGGDAQGPSGAMSGRWRLSEGETLSFHFLATDLDAKTPGPAQATPFARQRTIRGIPVVQLDSKLGSRGLLKSSVYFDAQYLKYEDPSASALPYTQDHVYQLGTEQALIWGNWKLGAGARSVRYQTIGLEDLDEMIGHVLVSRVWEPLDGALLIEPTLRAVGVSRYGILPEGSLGVRVPLSTGLAWFARGGYSRHYPSLTNRFYRYPGFPGYPGFVGNAALRPETDWTAIAGVEWKRSEIEADLQVYAQFTQDTQVRAPLDATTDTEVNLGNARMGSLLARIQGSPSNWLEAGVSATLSLSRLDQTGLGFPGLPPVLSVFWLELHAPRELAGGERIWALRLYERISGPALADTAGNRLPGYHEEDLELRARVAPGWTAVVRIDDLTDQRPELVRGYPGFGRAGSLLIARAW